MLDNLSTSYVPFRFCRRCSDNMALMCARRHSVAVRAAPLTMNDSIPKQFVSCSGVIAAPIGNSSISRDTFRMLATMDWRKPCLSSEEYQIVEWSWCSSTGTMYNWLDSEKETAREDLMLLEVVMIASLMSMQGSGIGVCRWIQIGNENYEILCPGRSGSSEYLARKSLSPYKFQRRNLVTLFRQSLESTNSKEQDSYLTFSKNKYVG